LTSDTAFKGSNMPFVKFIDPIRVTFQQSVGIYRLKVISNQ
jgi:hypothetical protein